MFKKILTSLIAILCLTTASAFAEEQKSTEFFTDFTYEDWCRQGLETVLWIIDWNQTLQIKNHQNMHETNVFLGKHPSDGEINAYMGTMIVSHALIAWALPTHLEVLGIELNPRSVWQYVFISTEALTVVKNYSIGLKFSF